MEANQIKNALPTSIALDRWSGWRGENATVSQREHLLAEDLAEGLRLPAHVGGALALDHSHGSLGGLVLPRGMAQHPSGALYLLDMTGRYDLRLMSVKTTDELEGEGCSLVIVALVGDVDGKDLHIRIFDASGEKVVDKAEKQLESGEMLVALKQHFTALKSQEGEQEIIDESSLSLVDRQEIIRKATSSAGHTLTGAWRNDEQELPEPDDAPRIRRYNPAVRCFEPLPHVGGYGTEARQFKEPANLVITEHQLYVADFGNRCLKTFHLNSLTLVHTFYGPDRLVPHPDGERGRELAWRPVDVAVGSNGVLVLDENCNRVFEHTPGSLRLSVVIDARNVSQRNEIDEGNFNEDDKWIRMEVDDDGRVYLLRQSKPTRVDVFTNEITDYEIPPDSHKRPNYIRSYGGLRYRFEKTISDAGRVRSLFTPPQVVLDHAQRFCLEGNRGAPCARRARVPSPPIEAPLAFCRGGASPLGSNARVFDRFGRELELSFDESSAGWAQPLYAREGAWYSESLDSKLYRCQWHRIELDLADLPAGTWVEVATSTSDQKLRKGSLIPGHLWDEVPRFTGPLQRELPLGQHDSRRKECLVLSPPGQFLNLRLRMGSHPARNDDARTKKNGGYATPVVAGLRVHYPRQSYAEYLPAVFAEDEESRSFLERFLSIFQTDWDRIEQQIDDIADLFDPATVPNEAFLDYLAEWLGITVEGSWDLTQKRRLVSEAKQNLGRWGTLESVRRHVGVYLHNISGVDPHSWVDDEEETFAAGAGKHGKTGEPPSGFPQLLENFRARRYQVLDDSAPLGSSDATLWSRSLVGRLQFDVFDREGKARIVGVGDPKLDFFYEHAHRFQVFVPSAWIHTKQQENLIHRAVYESAPAHTCHELCLVEARLRVGVQCTVGVDTIVGAIPTARLTESDQGALAPSQAPRHRLGYDMVLGRLDQASGVQVDRSHAGVGTGLS